jgi:hypothetical protein
VKRDNLPAHRVRLIGRDQDLVVARQALLGAEGRLMTLTGTGGCGKTRDTGNTLELVRSLEGLAGASVEAHPERTVRMAGTASALRDGLAAVHYPWERARFDCWLEEAHSVLGQEAYTVAWTKGRGMPVEQAIAQALSNVDSVQTVQASSAVAIDSLEQLSMREREVAQPVARGHSNRQNSW